MKKARNKIKALIIGAFEFETMSTGGQPVKTRELLRCLENKYGKQNVDFLDTTNWKKRPLHLLLLFFKKTRRANNVIMLPAHKGLFVFSKLLVFAKMLWKTSIFYDVIGGWLPNIVASKKKLAKSLKRFDGIWVETTAMKNELVKNGFHNVTIVNNFKNLSNNDSFYCEKDHDVIHLCTFSRVML